MRKIHIRTLVAATVLLGVIATPLASASAATVAAGQVNKVLTARETATSDHLSVNGGLTRSAIRQTNGTSLCQSNRTDEPFDFLIWSGGVMTRCIRAYTTIETSGTLSRFINGAAGRA